MTDIDHRIELDNQTDDDPEYQDDSSSLRSGPGSSGFDYDGVSPNHDESYEDEEDGHYKLDSQRRGSRESFTDRFKRYMRRLLPTVGARRSRGQELKAAGRRRQGRGSGSSRSRDDTDEEDDSVEAGTSGEIDHRRRQHRHSREAEEESGMVDDNESSFIDDDPIPSSVSGGYSPSEGGRSSRASSRARRSSRTSSRSSRISGGSRRSNRSRPRSRRSSRSSGARA